MSDLRCPKCKNKLGERHGPGSDDHTAWKNRVIADNQEYRNAAYIEILCKKRSKGVTCNTLARFEI